MDTKRTQYDPDTELGYNYRPRKKPTGLLGLGMIVAAAVGFWWVFWR